MLGTRAGGRNCDVACVFIERALGTAFALWRCMSDGFRRLVAWQWAREYKRAVYALASTQAVARDRHYAEHLRRTAASVELNIVEGYHRSSQRDFARFLTIARASLAEVEVQLEDGIDRGYFAAEDLADTNRLARRLVPALMGLRRWLLRRPS